MNNLEHLAPIEEILTPEEKELALRIIRIIASKNLKDKELVIDYNILYSQPQEEDKDAVIANLQERIKFSRKIIAEYKDLKESYWQKIKSLEKRND